MNKKNNKRALLVSALSIVLCLSMLVGTTFAWFTDTDTTAVNNIVSGTLDIEIVDKDGNVKTDALSFENVNGSSDIKWEPNATFRTQGFKLKNTGNLWLKYKIEVNNTEVSYNKLNEVIKFKLVKADGSEPNVTDLSLAPNTATTELLYIEGHMDQNAGNEYQNLTLSGVGITVYATQYTSEQDMTDNQYDKDAQYDDEVVAVATADEFIAAFANLEAGQTITLTADIDMTNKAWTPVNNKGFTLNGNNKTVTGLGNGLVGHTGSGEFVIKDITFDNMTAVDTYVGSTQSYAGLIGDADTCSYINMTNVTISNSEIRSTLVTSDGGAGYAAGFVAYTTGYNVDNNGPVYASHNFTNCKLENTTVNGTSSAGGLIGHCGGNPATLTNIKGFTTTGSTVTGEKTGKDGAIIGTAHQGTIYIDAANITTDIGRFVPVGTGKLIINGVEQTAFAN